MGWFASDKPENKRKRAEAKRAATRRAKKNQDDFAKAVGIGVTSLINPAAGIGMMLLSGAGKKKKKRR